MTRTRLLLAAAGLVIAALVIWAASGAVERAVRAPRNTAAAPDAGTPEGPTPQITATLFYGSQVGEALVGVQREVRLWSDVVSQGRAILAAQFEPAPEPYVSVIPEGTSLRAFYITPRGDAFVDVSADITTAHPGGSLTELLTVYAIVNAVTSNLPGVQRVQILVDGQEVDTIAGHVDVRRPLAPDTSLVASEPADEP